MSSLSGNGRTRVVVRRDALQAVGQCVVACRDAGPASTVAQVVADENTYEIAGREAERALRQHGLTVRSAIVLRWRCLTAYARTTPSRWRWGRARSTI
jgi:hypothetical protein